MSDMKKIPIVIDCDPGTDDAVAIMLAHASDKLDIKAITPVAGNVAYKYTSKNACDLAGLLGIDCRISKGADRALMKPFTGDATYVHGENGLGKVVLENKSGKTLEDKYAWDVIYEEAVKAKGELVICAVGPLTNIAITIMKHPDLKDYVKRLLIMGGSFTQGNITPYAEYNIWFDPHACELVLHSGIPITLCGLDCTNGAALTFEELCDCVKGESSVKEFWDAYLDFYRTLKTGAKKRDLGGKSIREEVTTGGLINPVHENSHLNIGRNSGDKHIIHDAITIAYLLDDTLFEVRPEHVVCETRGVNAGQTIVDFRHHLGKEPNCDVAMAADPKKFMALLREMMEFYRK